jgi:hypothetical protein
VLPGWAEDEKLEALRAAWFAATDETGLPAIASRTYAKPGDASGGETERRQGKDASELGTIYFGTRADKEGPSSVMLPIPAPAAQLRCGRERGSERRHAQRFAAESPTSRALCGEKRRRRCMGCGGEKGRIAAQSLEYFPTPESPNARKPPDFPFL